MSTRSSAAPLQRTEPQSVGLDPGRLGRIREALENHPNMREASEILHCDDVVGGLARLAEAARLLVRGLHGGARVDEHDQVTRLDGHCQAIAHLLRVKRGMAPRRERRIAQAAVHLDPAS